MKNGIAVAGNLIVDYIKMIDIYPTPGMLCNILEKSQSPGGCAVNTLGVIAAMDAEIPLWCCGCIGDDSGELYLGFFETAEHSYGGCIDKKGNYDFLHGCHDSAENGSKDFFSGTGSERGIWNKGSGF